MSVEVSVLIPVYEEAASLPHTAPAMLGQGFDGETEFLFIDGGSADGTLALLEEMRAGDPRVRILRNPRRRVAAALNVGLSEARGEFVARMDAHTIYPADYLARAIERLRAGGVSWVSGPQLALGERGFARAVARAMESPLGVGGATFRRTPPSEIETDTGYTGVWLRSTLTELGGWDEQALVNEDGELAARIRAGGGRIICLPELAAHCAVRGSPRALAAQYLRYGTYRARTIRLHPRSMRRSHALPPALVVTAVAAAAPGHGGRLARTGLGAWGLAVVAEAVHRAERPAQAPAVAGALATMHLSWGAGFLIGCARFGPPLAALAALARGGRAETPPRPV